MSILRTVRRSLGRRFRAANALAHGINPRKAPIFFDPQPVAEYRNHLGDPDFMPWMLPWIDRDGADIERYVKSLRQEPVGLKQQLSEWRARGLVIFRQALDHALIDAYVQDLRDLFANHTKYCVMADHELYNGPGGNVPLATIAKEHLTYRHLRIPNFHNLSVAGKKLALNRQALAFLEHVFGDK